MRSISASVVALLGYTSGVLALIPTRVGLNEEYLGKSLQVTDDGVNSSTFQQIIDHKVFRRSQVFHWLRLTYLRILN